MPNHSRWKDSKKQRPDPTDEEWASIEQGFALGEVIYELRTSARLSQRELADRMGTTAGSIPVVRSICPDGGFVGQRDVGLWTAEAERPIMVVDEEVCHEGRCVRRRGVRAGAGARRWWP